MMRGGRIWLERTSFVKGAMQSVIWPQGILNDSLESGVRELLSNMVNAIIELMNRYRQLGFERHHSTELARWQPEGAR